MRERPLRGWRFKDLLEAQVRSSIASAIPVSVVLRVPKLAMVHVSDPSSVERCTES